MGAGIYNFTIEQGADFNAVITYKSSAGVPIQIRDYEARLKIRKSQDSANSILYYDTTRPTMATGAITIGTGVTGATGAFTIDISDVETAAMDFDDARYDFEIIVPTTLKVIRLLKGQVSLDKEATK